MATPHDDTASPNPPEGSSRSPTAQDADTPISLEAAIRPARLEDASGIAAVHRDLPWLPQLRDEPNDRLEGRVRAQLERCFASDSHTVLVGVDASDRVLGYVAVHWLPFLLLEGPEGHVSELFLLDQARGHGLGQRLLDAVRKEATARGCSRLGLLNGRESESYERRFYAKNGWIERPSHVNFILPL